MPELPEAETLVRQLRKVFSGAVLSKVIVRRKDMVTKGLNLMPSFEGQKLASVLRRGKFIGLEFEGSKDSESILWFHLGMTGRLTLRDVWNDSDPHLHVILEWEKKPRKLLFQDVRRFGRVFVTSKQAESFPDGLREMGPEPLEISADDFRARFKNRSGLIKGLLLNQRIIAGIGNIYADECLFRAGIHPKRRPGRLNAEKFSRLHGAVQSVLKEAIAQGGSSIRDYISLEGQSGGFQRFHKVYGKQGKPCETCGQKIQKGVVAGRSSFFCSRCQQ